MEISLMKATKFTLSFFLLLIITMCSNNSTPTAGVVDDTHSIIALEGMVLTFNGFGVPNVLVKVANTPLMTETGNDGTYSMYIPNDSLSTIKFDTTTEKLMEYYINDNIINSIQFNSWNDSLPDVLVTQRNISGRLLGDISKVHTIIAHVIINNSPKISFELWHNTATSGYSGFWYTRKLSEQDSGVIVISTLDSVGDSIHSSDTLYFTNVAGDINIPDVTLGSAPQLSDISIIGRPQLYDTLHVNYTYTDKEDDQLDSISYQWYRDGGLIYGETGPSYIIRKKDIEGILAVELIAFTSSGFFIQSEAVLISKNEPIYQPPNFSGKLLGDLTSINSVIAIITLDTFQIQLNAIYDISSGKYSVNWMTSSDYNYNSATVQFIINTTNSNTYRTSIKAISSSNVNYLFEDILIGHAPRVENIKIGPSEAECSSIEVYYDFIDIEGDAEANTHIQWYHGDYLIVGANSKQYKIRDHERNSKRPFTAIVTPKASSGYFLTGQPINSEPTIAEFINQPPYLRNEKMLIQNKGDSITLKPTYTYIDVEGDPLYAVGYLWFVGDSIFKGDSTYTIQPKDSTVHSIMVELIPWSLNNDGPPCEGFHRTVSSWRAYW